MDNQTTEEKFYELKPYGIIFLGAVGLILQIYTGNSAKLAAGVCYISSVLLIIMGAKIIIWRSNSRHLSRIVNKKRY